MSRSESCGKCYYCARPIYSSGSSGWINDPSSRATRDHHTPFSITTNAALETSRIVAACQRCNNLKGDTAPKIFEYFIRQTNISQSAAKLQKEYRRFCYLLTVAGFRSAKAIAFVKAKQPPLKPREPIDLPAFLPPRRASILEAVE